MLQRTTSFPDMNHTACGEALLGCMGREMQQVLLDQQLLAVCPVQECLGCLCAFPLQDSSVVKLCSQALLFFLQLLNSSCAGIGLFLQALPLGLHKSEFKEVTAQGRATSDD